jgi:hypothetical protein
MTSDCCKKDSLQAGDLVSPAAMQHLVAETGTNRLARDIRWPKSGNHLVKQRVS